MTDAELPSFSPLSQTCPATEVDCRGEGCRIVCSKHLSANVPANLARILRSRSDGHPDRLWLLQRKPGHGPWEGAKYGEARRAADSIGQFA